MAYTKQQIIIDINAYMKKCGGTNAGWYVGIATDAKQRLFNDHNVLEKNDSWIYRHAESSDAARAVEKAYLDAGYSGGPGGGDDGTDYVYACRKTRTTRE
ncbi:MAG: hypothetical protein PHH36_01225 [Sideroxydans sp.]|nr:hypothetical protein [Sideroxydans sp.]